MDKNCKGCLFYSLCVDMVEYGDTEAYLEQLKKCDKQEEEKNVRDDI